MALAITAGRANRRSLPGLALGCLPKQPTIGFASREMDCRYLGKAIRSAKHCVTPDRLSNASRLEGLEPDFQSPAPGLLPLSPALTPDEDLLVHSLVFPVYHRR